MVKGIGCDQHRALPSLLPSEPHIFCWNVRWSDLRGGGSDNTITNQFTSYRTEVKTSAFAAAQSKLQERPSSTHYAMRHRPQSEPSSAEDMTCGTSAAIGAAISSTPLISSRDTCAKLFIESACTALSRFDRLGFRQTAKRASRRSRWSPPSSKDKTPTGGRRTPSGSRVAHPPGRP